MVEGYFQVMADPVSTWVQLKWLPLPLHKPRLVTRFRIPPRPCASPGYQFCTVLYLTSASFSTTISTTAAWSWFSSRIGAVQPSM